jgi:hypothetical protein
LIPLTWSSVPQYATLKVGLSSGRGLTVVIEPFLDLGDVGLVVERVGGGRRAQRMGADLETQRR